METNGEVRELKKHIDWLSAQVTDRDEIIDRLDRIEGTVNAVLNRQGSWSTRSSKLSGGSIRRLSRQRKRCKRRCGKQENKLCMIAARHSNGS